MPAPNYTCPNCGKKFKVTARNFVRANLHEGMNCKEAEGEE